jgi:methyl-accepting chemotaxis protein
LTNLSIKQKLILTATISVVGLISLLLFLEYEIRQTSNLGEAQSKVEVLKADMLMLRRNEKDFIMRKDLKYKKKFQSNVKKLQEHSDHLKFLLKGLKSSKIDGFDKVIVDYEKVFLKFIAKQQEIGLNPKDGLYGALRASVHKVQSLTKKANYQKALALTLDLRKHEKDFMLRRDLKYIEKFDKSFEKLTRVIRFNKTHFEEESKKAILQYLNDYQRDFKALVSAEEEIGLNSKVGIQGDMRKTIHKSETILDELHDELLINIQDAKEAMLINSLLISAVIIGIVVILTLIIIRDIGKSLSRFQKGLLNFFKYLNKESSTVELLKITNNDEIGTMSEVINQNIQKTKTTIESDTKFLNEVSDIVDEVNNGHLFHRLENQTQSQNLEELRSNLNTMLENLQAIVGGSTNKILNVLISLSELDFTNHIKDDNGKIPHALNEVTKLITDMLVESKSIGLTLQNSASTLMQNVKTLNTSSNEAAASLEETAAALEQITGNIRNNTDNIVKMAGYANELSSSTKEGEKLAGQTTTSMNEINEQVNAINEAITVIDQIAFQTNILSLNAAVEAATAGEAGKGFAVVAGEVRNLAARSAEAASEIKALVENATTKTTEGKHITDQMIDGYSKLSENISNTLSIITDVEHASKEQLTGIEQINDALNELDKQTQENVSVANVTYEISQQTEDIANLIVKNADEKTFNGKDEVEAKEYHKKTNTKSSQEDTKTVSNTTQEKQETPKEIVSDNTNDEWESF